MPVEKVVTAIDLTLVTRSDRRPLRHPRYGRPAQFSSPVAIYASPSGPWGSSSTGPPTGPASEM